MRNVVVEAIEHPLPVTGVEGGIVTGQQGKGSGTVHRSLLRRASLSAGGCELNCRRMQKRQGGMMLPPCPDFACGCLRV